MHTSSTYVHITVSHMHIQYISVCVQAQQMMTFGGTTDPCALIEVMSIGKLGVEENKVLSKIIFDFIKEKLGIEGTRYIYERVKVHKFVISGVNSRLMVATVKPPLVIGT